MSVNVRVNVEVNGQPYAPEPIPAAHGLHLPAHGVTHAVGGEVDALNHIGGNRG